MFSFFKRSAVVSQRTSFDDDWDRFREAATSASERAEIDAIFARHSEML